MQWNHCFCWSSKRVASKNMSVSDFLTIFFCKFFSKAWPPGSGLARTCAWVKHGFEGLCGCACRQAQALKKPRPGLHWKISTNIHFYLKSQQYNCWISYQNWILIDILRKIDFFNRFFKSISFFFTGFNAKILKFFQNLNCTKSSLAIFSRLCDDYEAI